LVELIICPLTLITRSRMKNINSLSIFHIVQPFSLIVITISQY
jgi:hypothetical protein